jgi:hypothetical protein
LEAKVDELRSRTVAMLDKLTDDQVVLVQDYARYLKDKRSWDDAVALLGARPERAPESANVLEQLLAES